MRKRKRDERKQTLHVIYPVVSVGTKSPLVHVVKALTQEYCFLVTMGVFDMPALEGLASEPGSGQPELGPERPVALFDVVVWLEPG
jgi:hypothetical protein